MWAILAGIVFPFVCPNGLISDYSEGSRIGHINKFSKKGIFFKSYEGQLAMEQIKTTMSSDGNVTIDNIFEFSAKSEVAEKINLAMESNYKIKLFYKQYWIKPMKIDTKYLIYDVKILDGKE